MVITCREETVTRGNRRGGAGGRHPTPRGGALAREVSRERAAGRRRRERGEKRGRGRGKGGGGGEGGGGGGGGEEGWVGSRRGQRRET